MDKSRYLCLAYRASGTTAGALALALILLPDLRVWAMHLCFMVAIAAHTVLGVYAERLQGLTLKGLYDDFRQGRRRPQSSWHTVLLILVLAAIFLAGPEVS